MKEGLWRDGGAARVRDVARDVTELGFVIMEPSSGTTDGDYVCFYTMRLARNALSQCMYVRHQYDDT